MAASPRDAEGTVHLDDPAAGATLTHGGDPEPAPGGDPVGRAVAALDSGAPGPLLVHGDVARGRHVAGALAEALGTTLERLAGDTVGVTGDAVADLTRALRDAVHLRVRVLRKVFEGRLDQVKALGPDPGPAARRFPPSQIELTLSTDEDTRTLRLEGAFAAALHATGAQLGDVVQIDREVPLATLRPGREPEGRVLEERDLVYHVRLGDRDRAHMLEPAEPAEEADDDEDESNRRANLPVPRARPLFGTGRHPEVSVAGMQATDRWVQGQLGGKGTRLEAAVLLVEDAHRLPEEALVALREAIRSPVSPIVVLQSDAAADLEAWERRFDAAQRLDA